MIHDQGFKENRNQEQTRASCACRGSPVQTANRFSAQVSISKDGQTADGRSIMGVLTLAATQGSKIQVEAVGDDAEQAVKAIERIVDKRFNENE